ncbi:MAG: DUF3440 domain-containing protein [Bacteroidales bacterium]
MNVYESAKKRIELIFNEFDNICISFSGGKDSGVMLNLCIEYIRDHKLDRKISVFHMDYEAQYQMTTEYVDKVLSENNDIIDVYRCCIPFKVTTCTSMSESFWRPWEASKKDIWVRDLPDKCYTEKDFPFFEDNMWDYDFQIKFGEWLHAQNHAKKTACLVGIRTQESLNRWRTIFHEKNRKRYKGLKWTTKMSDNIYNLYPIYDWRTEDVWIANGKFGWSYNKLYDLFYMAGVGIEKQRVASPFISEGKGALSLYKAIEPHTWGKLISRVNGVNFTGIYGGTTAMGWKSITLPKGHTWESYMYFLLDTLPPKAKASYTSKLETSMKFWQERGGVLSQEVIDKLKAAGVKIEVLNHTNYQTKKLPVRMKYLDDIDIKEFKEIPTYKRMCICIMKNDHLCKYMGFSQTKNELLRRKKILNKYKSIL